MIRIDLHEAAAYRPDLLLAGGILPFKRRRFLPTSG